MLDTSGLIGIFSGRISYIPLIRIWLGFRFFCFCFCITGMHFLAILSDSLWVVNIESLILKNFNIVFFFCFSTYLCSDLGDNNQFVI